MKHKPDDRSDNVEKIQRNINHTIQNIELANEMIDKVDNQKTRQELKDKNEKREAALNGMREEIRDEVKAQEKGYQ